MGDDVLYILGEPLTSNTWSLTEQQVSRLMMAFYSNFISYGYVRHCHPEFFFMGKRPRGS